MYSKTNFIVKSGDDTSLKFRDNRGQIKYTVYNNNECTFYNSNNTIVIRTDGDASDIVLDFLTKTEAIQALGLLNIEFSKIKARFKIRETEHLIEDLGGTISGDIKELIFSNEPGANSLSNNQVIFNIPNSLSINSVLINGIAINDFTYNHSTKNITLDTDLIGYTIEDSDEIVVKYY